MKTKITLSAVLAFTFVISAFAIPARAETEYRYWSFWIYQNGQWQYANSGAGTTAVNDQTIDAFGWRFVTSNGKSVEPPRTGSEFGKVCNPGLLPDNQIQREVVIDFGNVSDNPGAGLPPTRIDECMLVPKDGTAAQLLSKLSVRENNGFICAIDAWPATGCGDAVESATVGAPSVKPDAMDEFANRVTIGLGVVLFALAWRALLIQKRRKPNADG